MLRLSSPRLLRIDVGHAMRVLEAEQGHTRVVPLNWAQPVALVPQSRIARREDSPGLKRTTAARVWQSLLRQTFLALKMKEGLTATTCGKSFHRTNLRKGGVEPPRPFGHRILKAACGKVLAVGRQQVGSLADIRAKCTLHRFARNDAPNGVSSAGISARSSRFHRPEDR